MLFNTPFVSLPANTQGRDFCIGDLHGCLGMLRSLLSAVKFNPNRDRLFSVGDLIHRGPNSLDCLALAEEPWFFPVAGNHEILQEGAWEGHSLNHRSLKYICEDNGGRDLLGREVDAGRFLRIIKGLPLTLEVELPNQERVGIIHAGLMHPFTWHDVQAMVAREPRLFDKDFPGLQRRLLWDRTSAYAAEVIYAGRAGNLDAGQRERFSLACAPIPGIDLLICGHTSLESGHPLQAGTRLFLDTGAGFNGGPLTMLHLEERCYWSAPDPAHQLRAKVRKRNHVPTVDVSSLGSLGE